MLVVAANLIVLGVPTESLEQLPMLTVWLQTGCWIGLVAGLIGGSALLWYVLRRSWPSEGISLQRTLDASPSNRSPIGRISRQGRTL